MKRIIVIRAFAGMVIAAVFCLVMQRVYTERVVTRDWRYMNRYFFERMPPRIDTLLLGDSHIVCNIMPLDMPRAYSLASLGQSYVMDYYHLKEVIAEGKQPIERIILPIEYTSFRTHQLMTMPLTAREYVDYFAVAGDTGEWRHFTKQWAQHNLVSFGGHWNFTRQLVEYPTDPPYPREFTSHTQGGFYQWWPGTMVEPDMDASTVERADSHFPENAEWFDRRVARYLSRILALCAEHNIEVFLLRSPVPVEYRAAVAERIPLAEFEARVDELLAETPPTAIFDHRDWADGRNEIFGDPDHLNHAGARLFTEQILEDLRLFEESARQAD